MAELEAGAALESSSPRCAHCALPLVSELRRSRRRPADDAVPEPLYCCLGCRLAATIAGGKDGPRQFLEARLLLATFLAMGVMTFSLVLYGETLHGATDEAGLAAIRNIGRLVLALFALPVLLLLGLPLMGGAVADLRRGQVRMDGLIVLATTAAYGLSLHATWTGTGQVYFETATMVLVLVTFGRRLEAATRTRGADAAEALAECLPEHAHRLRGDRTVDDVVPGALVPGDRCELRPGERVPADGVVLEGSGPLVLAHLTGEEAPRHVAPGDALPAGAVNGTAALLMTVVRPTGDSRLARIRRLLDEPLDATRTMRIVDRWAAWLAWLAVLLAGAGGIAFARTEGAGAGLAVALAVLLVACPCALGLATPLAFRAMRTSLAQKGVLVHDAAALETAAAIDHVVLDKTGTLTEASGPLIVSWSRAPVWQDRLERLMRHSGHALADALDGSTGPVPDGLRLVPGCGVQGVVDGLPLRAGSPAWILGTATGPATDAGAGPTKAGARLSDAGARSSSAGAAPASSLVLLESDGEVVATAQVAHRLRERTRAAVAELGALGTDVEVLSGDRAAAAAALSSELGVPCRGELLPEDKLARVEQLRRDGHRVLAAGDGVNDAPALRAADVGVALGSGTAAARANADVELLNDDVAGLALLLRAARDLRRCVRGNLAWAVAYNAVALGLAVTGRLHPLAAVIAMIASSIVVSIRSHRLLDWQAPVVASGPAASGTEPGPDRAPQPRGDAGDLQDARPAATTARLAPEVAP